MATNRFGYSDDFVLNNGKVGINSASPQEKLDVVGVVKGDRLKVAGVSSFTVYEGFLNSTQNIVENVSLNSGNGITGSLSGEVIVGTGITVTIGEPATSVQNYIESLKVYNTFTVPVGGTTDRPTTEKSGQLFFNRDFGTIEFWDGDRWRQVDNGVRSGRGVFGGGLTPTSTSSIQYINISSLGNSLNFGSLITTRRRGGGCSSSIRGLIAGAMASDSPSNVIEYITIASESNAIDFGDLTVVRVTTASCSSSTRGLWAGGYAPESNVIDYVQISTLGNALDFGDLSDRGDGRGGQRLQVSSCSSSTRGVFAGGTDESPALVDYSTIDYITIASTGNAVGGGDLTSKSSQGSACSNSTRGIFAEVRTSLNSITTNLISYVTIATLGNAIKFGDLTLARYAISSTASQIRGVFAGGTGTPSLTNTIDYITISSTGNAQDFGDLSISAAAVSSLSDSHGGLGGF